MRRKVHVNIRSVTVGPPIAYCHGADVLETVTDDHGKVTCGPCCDFIERLSPATGAAEMRAEAWHGFAAFGVLAVMLTVIWFK